MPDDEKPKEEKPIAPSPDPAQSEDRPEVKLKPVIEDIENHETVPAWFKPYAQKLDAVFGVVTAKPKVEGEKPEPKVEEKKEEQDGKKEEKPKSKRVRLWRTIG